MIILATKYKWNHMFKLGAGAEICLGPEPEKSKMTGSGNPVTFPKAWIQQKSER